jgi:hypothetical protein
MICIFAGALVSCSKSTDAPDGMKIATCEGDKFRVYIPEAWTSTAPLGIAGGYALSNVHSSVSFAEYNSDAKSAEEFLTDFVADSFDVYFDMELVEKGSGLIADKSASSVLYTFVESGAFVKMLLMATEHEGAYYMFTYVAEDSIYDRYLDTAIDIASKIKFDVPYVGTGASEDTSDGAPEGMKLASDKNLSYKLFVPSSWTVDSSEITSAYVESDKANVSVTEYVPETDIISIDQYWDICKAEYEKYLTDYTAISERVEGKLGKRLAYVYEFSAKVDAVEYKFMQAIAVNGSRICVLTYTATPETYELHRADVEAMMSNFKFK